MVTMPFGMRSSRRFVLHLTFGPSQYRVLTSRAVLTSGSTGPTLTRRQPDRLAPDVASICYWRLMEAATRKSGGCSRVCQAEAVQYYVHHQRSGQRDRPRADRHRAEARRWSADDCSVTRLVAARSMIQAVSSADPQCSAGVNDWPGG
jgi:hypothetical protein